MRQYTLRFTLAGLILIVVGCDQGTKQLARHELADTPPVVLLQGWLDLSYTENPGVSFGFMRSLPDGLRVPLLIGLVGVSLSLFGWMWLSRREWTWWQELGFALAIAGGLGNLIDRVIRGRVIDFIHWHGWPLFNVADIAVALAVPLVALALWRQQPTPPAPPPTAS